MLNKKDIQCGIVFKKDGRIDILLDIENSTRDLQKQPLSKAEIITVALGRMLKDKEFIEKSIEYFNEKRMTNG